MKTLTLLLPSLGRIGAFGMPRLLARWLAQGDRLADAGSGREVALRECFEFTGTVLPVAALTRSLDATDARGALWLRADPSYVTADAVTARLLACGTVDLSADENDELTRSLKPVFGDAGFPLEPATPGRWYLRCPPGSRLPRFASPQEALGDDLMQHLPQGENEQQWRHLLNEAQVILHNHPVNARRTARGQMPGNSLWFWGAGELPDWVRAPFTCVLSRDDVVAALAGLAKISVDSPVSGSNVQIGANDTLLIDLADIRDTAALEQSLAPVAAALKRGNVTVRLLTEDGRRVRVKRAHRWRFWRRVPSAGTEEIGASKST